MNTMLSNSSSVSVFSITKKPMLCLLLIMTNLLTGCGSDDSSDGDTNTSSDSTPPLITLVGNERIEVVYNAVFGDLGAELLMIRMAITVTTEGTINTTIPGTYELTYTATDANGNSSQTTRTVVVLEDTSENTITTNPEHRFHFFMTGAKRCRLLDRRATNIVGGHGFDGIVGIDTPELTFDSVLKGGAWSSDINCGADAQNHTASTLLNLLELY